MLLVISGPGLGPHCFQWGTESEFLRRIRSLLIKDVLVKALSSQVASFVPVMNDFSNLTSSDGWVSLESKDWVHKKANVHWIAKTIRQNMSTATICGVLYRVGLGNTEPSMIRMAEIRNRRHSRCPRSLPSCLRNQIFEPKKSVGSNRKNYPDLSVPFCGISSSLLKTQ